MPTKVLRLVADAENGIAFEKAMLPEPGSGQVLVETAYSFVSAGTELSLLQMSPNPNFRRPVVRERLGYSLSGVVVATGAGVDHVKRGDRVACLGEGAFHSSRVLMAKNLVTPLPEAVSLKEASLVAMLCFSLEAIHKAQPEFGENALVAGAGMMGQITARLLLALGNRVWMVDRNSRRLAHAPRSVKTLEGSSAAWARFARETQPYGIEAAYVCLGGEATGLFERIKGVMSLSPDGIRHGRIIFPGGATLTVSMASPSGNLRLISSAKAGAGYRDARYENENGYPATYIKWDVRRNAATMLRAIADETLEVSPLITHLIPFGSAADAYHLLAQPDTEAMGVLLDHGHPAAGTISQHNPLSRNGAAALE
ncbi:MAG TPA: zinc-binding alcohol dehydrogenase [Chthoniobacteraceae bacterium]|nr:zinc-binding alcohol dehydrogenase [Chthoniobacteraceae bacterium]